MVVYWWIYYYNTLYAMYECIYHNNTYFQVLRYLALAHEQKTCMQSSNEGTRLACFQSSRISGRAKTRVVSIHSAFHSLDHFIFYSSLFASCIARRVCLFNCIISWSNLLRLPCIVFLSLIRFFCGLCNYRILKKNQQNVTDAVCVCLCVYV